MSTVDTVEALASSVTALGVLGVGCQLFLTWKQMKQTFEQTFATRYQDITRRLPLDVLLGKYTNDLSRNDVVMRAFLDYFQLCEEELYFLKRGKISQATWVDWWEGIRENAQRRPFGEAWAELSVQLEPSGEFANLRKVWGETDIEASQVRRRLN